MEVDRPEDIENEEEHKGFSLSTLIRFLKFWPLFAGLMAGALGIAALYLRYATPIYETSASLLIKDEHQGLANSKLFASLNMKTSEKIIENEVEVLGSRSLMQDVVMKLGLYAPLFIDGDSKKRSAYNLSPIKVMLRDPESLLEEAKIPFTFDATNKRVVLDNQSFPLNVWLNLKWGAVKFTPNERARKGAPINGYYFALTGVRTAANSLLQSLHVTQATKQTTVVGLNIRTELPKLGEDILNELIKSYNEQAMKDKSMRASNTLAFLENRLEYLVHDLDSVESKVQRFKMDKGIVNMGEQGYNILNNVESNERQLDDINGQLAILNKVDRYISGGVQRQYVENAPVVPSSTLSQSGAESIPVNAVESKELMQAKAHLASINTQLAVLRDAPPVDKYYNMRIIRLQNEMSALQSRSDRQDAKDRLAASDVIMKALRKRSLSDQDNVDDVSRRQIELSQERVDVAEEISSLSFIKSAPAPRSETRRVIRQPSGSASASAALPSTVGLKDNTLTNLLQRYYDLQNEYERNKRTVAEGSPAMVSLQSQIEKTQTSIQQNIRSQRNNLEAGKENLVINTDSYNSKLRNIPVNEKDLDRIGRTQTTTKEIYSFLLQKREENALLLASDISDNKLLDYAETSPFPVAPKKMLVFAIAVVAAIGLGIGIVLIKLAYNPSIESKAQLMSLVQLPVIAEINQSDGKASILSHKNENQTISEQFRQLRTSLAFMGILPGKKYILITSSVPGEGKSFVAVNLAISLALTEKRVLLVELDLHKAKIAGMLEESNGKGMSEYLSGNASLDEVLKTTAIHPGLSLVSAGIAPENPSELILGSRMDQFFKEINERFDYILIKSPPLSQLTDAFVLSKKTDATIVVVRQGYTPLQAVRMLESGNAFSSLSKASIVLNGVKENALEERLR
ncbi:MAG: polysaccharide biosynthesis tyrosine autokinase [Chitinophagaceae bacterium]